MVELQRKVVCIVKKVECKRWEKTGCQKGYKAKGDNSVAHNFFGRHYMSSVSLKEINKNLAGGLVFCGPNYGVLFGASTI